MAGSRRPARLCSRARVDAQERFAALDRRVPTFLMRSQPTAKSIGVAGLGAPAAECDAGAADRAGIHRGDACRRGAREVRE